VGLMNALSRLDAKVVPRLSRGLVRVAGALPGWRVRPLTVVATLLVLAVGTTATWRLIRPEPGGSYGTSPAWVGVREGDSIPGYVGSARAELAALAAQSPDRSVLALVSLREYLTPDQVASVVGAVPGIGSVIWYGRVPLPGRQTELVHLPAQRLPDDVVAGMAGVAGRKELDADSFETLAGEQTEASLKLIYASNAEVSRAEAAAYKASCACVYALLVRATPGVLIALSEQAEVRAVDPAQDVDNPDDAVISPPLPEQVDLVEPPADEVLPSAR
jgi:hypothetical protein